ncbi:MAG: hypothetical protein KAV87_22765 [Desulfobacteraceae bacterium]|nr:hypothetical protein [Desulfobacteraceae bacterium]
MAEQVFYIRGIPQSLSLEHPTARKELLEDLKGISGLSDKKLKELCEHLNKIQGFLTPKAFLEAIRKVITESSVAEAIRRIIINIGPSQVEWMVTSLEEKSKEKDFPFDQAQFDRLKQILKNIIQPYPSLARFQKAERLAKITGQQLETVELICDIRPVFDENRKNVEGMMPYTRLHIVATGEDGLPNAFEVELTHQEVTNLAEKAEKAKSKLEALRQSIEKWLPGGLPDLPLTRIPRKEPSDA